MLSVSPARAEALAGLVFDTRDSWCVLCRAQNENKFVKCDDVNCISNLLKGSAPSCSCPARKCLTAFGVSLAVWFRDLPDKILDELPQDAITDSDSVRIFNPLCTALIGRQSG